MSKQYLGLDFGIKRVGVAIGDDTARLASPLVTLGNDAQLLTKLAALAAEHEAQGWVLGLPRGLDGQDTDQTRLTLVFAEQLKTVGLPIWLQDEAVTSGLAASRGAKHDKLDQEAAAIILQDYLDSL